MSYFCSCGAFSQHKKNFYIRPKNVRNTRILSELSFPHPSFYPSENVPVQMICMNLYHC